MIDFDGILLILLVNNEGIVSKNDKKAQKWYVLWKIQG